MILPKCSLIISVYKDTESLELILESLVRQTLKPDEVIISEDGNSTEMAQYFIGAKERFSNLDLVHLFQEDIGWRKNIALNRAIMASKYEYLIFIDGDCVPYSNFIQAHIENAQQKIVLCGKRFELGPEFSAKVKKSELSLRDIEKNFLWYLPKMLFDNARHPEDGLIFTSHSFISKQIHKRYVRHIIGCNFSCYKDDFLKINGFDEIYKLPSEGEDVDPSWRFRGSGIELKSCRNNANIFHLYHQKGFSAVEGDINKTIMAKHRALNLFYCENGLVKQKESLA